MISPEADEQHARFRHPKSDFLSWLQLWIYFEDPDSMRKDELGISTKGSKEEF